MDDILHTCYNHNAVLVFVSHYSDVMMNTIKSLASRLFAQPFVQAQIKECQSSAPMAFVMGIHRWRVDSPRQGPVTLKMFPFDDVIVKNLLGLGLVVETHHKIVKLDDNSILTPMEIPLVKRISTIYAKCIHTSSMYSHSLMHRYQTGWFFFLRIPGTGERLEASGVIIMVTVCWLLLYR